MPLRLEILCAISNVLVYSKKEGTIVVFKDLTLDRRCEQGVWEFVTADNFWSIEQRDNSVRTAERRAEYSALRVDKEISLSWR